MEKLSLAQETFTREILEISYDVEDDSVLSRDRLRDNLVAKGITDFSESDFNSLCESLSTNNQMSEIARYTKGHLFSLYSSRTALVEQIATKLGGLNAKDFADFDLFKGRVIKLSDFASERNCLLYVDAEQTFIQTAIESFGQQMTHKLNRGSKVIIMNGFQCYLKRMAHVLPMEVKAARTHNFNLGIKMIRGAYMNEERSIAA